MNNMGLEEYKGVFIYAQQVDNELSSIAFELIGKAKDRRNSSPSWIKRKGLNR